MSIYIYEIKRIYIYIKVKLLMVTRSFEKDGREQVTKNNEVKGVNKFSWIKQAKQI